VHLPWRAPFADPAIFEHPLLLTFLELFWGTANFRCTGMHSNTPFPGSRYQRWHRDGGGSADWGAAHAGASPGTNRNCFLGVNIPLCDTSEANGSFEIVPGSHTLADFYHAEKAANDDRYNVQLLRGSGGPGDSEALPALLGATPPERVNVRRGDVWVRDPRALHRGTPNSSASPRPEIILGYARGRHGTGPSLFGPVGSDYDRVRTRQTMDHSPAAVPPST
jgi:ectoine hydroxylase-related dioxygenase (phytanoyl-CoA dioxygenase family)